LAMNSETSEPRPVLRILHHMARSGGTIISRCLGAMDRVVLLSEIHPLGAQIYNPLDQASDWYELLTKTDITLASSTTLGFADAIMLIEKRCRERGDQLVLRDWSHLDYTGVPFTRPVGHSRLVQALEPHFRLLRFATVRHPLDQWLSMNRQAVMHGKIKPSVFLAGARAFARMAMDTGFVRYEDFTAEPDDALERICAGLDLQFDAEYRGRWQDNVFVTGDVHPGRAGDRIRSLPRQNVDPAFEKSFTASPACTALMALLGYASDRTG
jgi:hypothetical protein